jgi:ABC-type Mn2+/Zn2+ transport system permease subunit
MAMTPGLIAELISDVLLRMTIASQFSGSGRASAGAYLCRE